jgi:hypothetical protein
MEKLCVILRYGSLSIWSASNQPNQSRYHRGRFGSILLSLDAASLFDRTDINGWSGDYFLQALRPIESP